jgi:hypothetical protein
MANRLQEVGDPTLIVSLGSRADLRDIKGLQGEFGHNAEVVSVTLQSPEEIRVLGLVDRYLCSVSKDKIVTDHIVHGESPFVVEVVPAADKTQFGDTNCFQATTNSGTAVRVKS